MSSRNDSQHRYYSVMVSIAMRSRGEVWAARADMIGPSETLCAAVGEVDSGAGCDTVTTDDSTQVRTTYRDCAGKAWERRNDGRLRHVRAPRNRDAYPYLGRPR